MHLSPRLGALLIAAALWLGGCASLAPQLPATSAGWPDPAARQLLLVLFNDWDSTDGSLRRYARSAEGRWQPVGQALLVSLGRSGSAWGIGLHPPQPGLAKREGDGRAPAGVFTIGPAFGYAAAHDTALPWLALEATHWCIDVPGSPLYNRIVDVQRVGQAAIAGSSEPMRRDIHLDGDQRYRLGWVIEHNAEGVDGAGSCIFAHLWQAPGVSTAGCTAMDEAAMRTLLDWLDPAARPRLVSLPQAEYLRLREAWALP